MNNKEAIEKVDKAIKTEFFKRCNIGCELAEALGIVVRLATNAIDNDTPEKPLADLINREALKEDLAKEIKTNDMGLWLKILLVIDNVPAVDISGNEYFPYRTAYFNGVRDGRATARPRGKWLFKHNSSDIWCSVCDENYNEIPQAFDFCPNCGADMRGGATNE